MATVHYKTCDRCGKKLDPMHDYEDCNIETPSTYVSVDLCESCAKQLDKMIGDFVGVCIEDGAYDGKDHETRAEEI